MERRLDELERKIDRILEELKRDDAGEPDRNSGDGAEETDAPVYDDLKLDEAGFESY